MGILLDVVPNHMGINDPGNVWWLDVLENGEGSYFADFFDIDWRPAGQRTCRTRCCCRSWASRSAGAGEWRAASRLRQRPAATGILRSALSARAADVAGSAGAAPAATTDARRPATNGRAPIGSSCKASSRNCASCRRALERDADAMERALPRAEDRPAAAWPAAANIRPACDAAFDAAISEINGEQGDPQSFDRLEELLDEQWYRLAYWRVASDEINYRRFFDINDLAAIRVEDSARVRGRPSARRPTCSKRVGSPAADRPSRRPARPAELLQESCRRSTGRIAAVRRRGGAEIYVVAEKILSGDEQLPTDWAVCGTTGYDLLNIVSRLQVDADGLAELREFYDEVTGNTAKPADVVYESKRDGAVQHAWPASCRCWPPRLVSHRAKHRASRDFTRPALQRALREVIACMTVYRTYVRADSWDVSEADYRTVTTAVRMAKRRNRTLPRSVFDFIASVLLLEYPPTLTDEQAAERREFALKLQQVSGPVAAKGVEDTAFYRYYPLASLNEVGGELDASRSPSTSSTG